MGRPFDLVRAPRDKRCFTHVGSRYRILSHGYSRLIYLRIQRGAKPRKELAPRRPKAA